MIIVAHGGHIYAVTTSCSASLISAVPICHWLIFNVFRALPRGIKTIYWYTYGINCRRCYVFARSPDIERWTVTPTRLLSAPRLTIIAKNAFQLPHCHSNLLFENLINSVHYTDSNTYWQSLCLTRLYLSALAERGLFIHVQVHPFNVCHLSYTCRRKLKAFE